MVRRTGDIEADPVDRDERLGEAIEAYLALAEAGQTPDPATFAAGYPDLEDDLFAALEGLALVQGLVGGPGGPGHRLESGRRVAGYRIVRELGRGGMGVVYEAVHVGLDRPVALKVLGSNAAPDSSGRRRFLNEARTAAGLHHTHIVPVFDVGQVGGLCYYAMQRIEGSGLDRVIKHLRRDRSVAAGSTYPGRPGSQHPTLRHPIDLSATGPVGDSTATWAGRPPGGLARDDDETTPFEPPRGAAYYRWVAGVGRQAAEALAHAHQRGVIHRDVKPSNLLVDARGVIWMADFGLARRLADPSQTQVDSLLGTPRYMSPEQARTGPIDGRTDVYSLGATLYELLTLRPPFEGKTAAELIDQIAGREPVPPRQFDPRLPRDLETIVLKALHKRTGDRYETAADLADDLERFVNHEPVRARRIGPVGRAWRIARRHPSLTIVSAVAAATVIASSTIAYVRVLHERDDARAARQDAQEIAVELEKANLQTRSALRSSLIQNAEVVRMSSVADRRATGLGLLKQAAALAAGPDDGARLRDEAVAFLAIRDVEKRPDLPIADRLQAVVFGDDGGHLATLSEDGTLLRFWDVRTRALVDTHDLGSGSHATPSPPPGVAGGASRGRGASWRLWPRLVASGPDIVVVQPDGKALRLFDAATGVASGSLRPFEHVSPRVGPPAPEREFVGVVASTDGRRFVTIDRPIDTEPGRRPAGPAAFRVHLWDAASPGRPLASLYEPKVDPRAEAPGRFLVPLVAIAPDGSTIAVAEVRDSEIALWSRDGKLRDTVDSQAQLTALALGPEGLLAAAGNRAVQIWDLTNARSSGSTATWLAALAPNQGYVDSLRFGTEDATILAVSGRGTGIELWDVPAAARVATLPVSDDWHGLALAPRGDLLAVGQPTALTLWGVVNPLAQTQIAGFKQPVGGLAFSAAGDLAMASRDGSIRLWSAGHCAATARVVETVRGSAIAYDADGRLLVQERDRLAWLGPDSQPPGLAVTLPDLPPRPGRGNGPNVPTAPAIAQTADGRVVAMTRFHEILLGRISPEGRPEGVVAIAPPEPADPAPMPQAPRPAGARPPRRIYRDVALAPNGDRLYVVSFPDEAVSAFAIQGDRLERLPWTLDGRSTRIALSPDGSTLAVGDRAGVVLLVDARSGAVAHRLAPPEGDSATPVDAVAFAPDGHGLAVGSRDQVRLWELDAVRPRPFVRLPGHRGSVLALAYSPEGQFLASGGEDRTVRVWDLIHVRGELTAIGLK